MNDDLGYNNDPVCKSPGIFDQRNDRINLTQEEEERIPTTNSSKLAADDVDSNDMSPNLLILNCLYMRFWIVNDQMIIIIKLNLHTTIYDSDLYIILAFIVSRWFLKGLGKIT